MASITTRVTPGSRSRSASRNSERVIVEYVAISCARRPGVCGLGTPHTHHDPGLPDVQRRDPLDDLLVVLWKGP